MPPSNLRNLVRQKYSTILVLVICCAVFVLRGPLRAAVGTNLNDLISPYTQATAFVHGHDPYSSQSLFTFWPSQALAARPDPKQFENGSILLVHGMPTAYPPTSFLLLAPFTALPWTIFKWLMIILNTALFILAIRALALVSQMDGCLRTMFFSASLLFAPFHTGIATCNLAIIATELGLISVWAEVAGSDRVAGLLIAVSTGLKPQIGLCFLGYCLLRQRWRSGGWAVGAVGVMSAASVIRLAIANVSWIHSYKSDNRALFSTGVLGDFTERNPLRFGLVNLQVALYPLLHNRTGANICAMSLAGFLLMAGIAFFFRKQKPNDLLLLSVLGSLSLLPIYHRFYDATLLIVPLSYLMVRRGRASAIGLAALCAFLLPGGSLLETLRDRGVIPSVLSDHVWWNSLVMAHAVWCLLILSIILLYKMWAETVSLPQTERNVFVKSQGLEPPWRLARTCARKARRNGLRKTG